jgi:hypothetical protein
VTRVVAAHQPNFLPWLGFWDKLRRADVFVLLDDVQFPREGAGVWTNRVQLLVSGRPQWVTVPIRRAGRGLQRVRDVRIDESRPWRRKLLRTIEVNYGRAPGFDEAFPLVSELIRLPTDVLAELNEHGIRQIAAALGLDAGKLVRGSSIATAAAGTELLVELTLALGGTAYLSGDGAGGYQDAERYAERGLELRVQGFEHPSYPQAGAGPVHGLSIVDALLHCGVEGTRRLLRLDTPPG